jgi:hypothetical protein
MIDISNIDKATLLAALFNNSKPLGLGFFAPNHNIEMTKEQAKTYIDAGQTYFDYLNGRVMKVNIAGDTLDSWGYDRNNGNNAAKNVVDGIRANLTHEFVHALPTNELEKAAQAKDAEKAFQIADSLMQFK